VTLCLDSVIWLVILPTYCLLSGCNMWLVRLSLECKSVLWTFGMRHRVDVNRRTQIRKKTVISFLKRKEWGSLVNVYQTTRHRMGIRLQYFFFQKASTEKILFLRDPPVYSNNTIPFAWNLLKTIKCILIVLMYFYSDMVTKMFRSFVLPSSGRFLWEQGYNLSL